MSKQKGKRLSDLEECQLKIHKILLEYNCTLMSADEWSRVLIYDNDTFKTVAGNKGE